MSTDDEALKAALAVTGESELVVRAERNAEEYILLGRALLDARRERDEGLVQLQAWQTAFGTTQLTHAIGLFIEYRDQHGYDEPAARAKAVGEVIDAATIGAPLSAAVERVIEAVDLWQAANRNDPMLGSASIALMQAWDALRAARGEGGKT